MELCTKHAVLLPFYNVHLLTYNDEGVVEIPPYSVWFGFCHTPSRHSQWHKHRISQDL